MNLSSFFKSKKSTGIFIPDGLNYKELTTYSGNGSINDIAKYLGYEESQTHTYFGDFDESNDIRFIILKVFTRDIVFIGTKDTVLTLSKYKVDYFLRDLDLLSEFDSVSVKAILEKGIEEKSLPIKFLSDIFKIQNPDLNGTFFVKEIDLFLHFSEGFLVDFQSSNGLNDWANYFMNINPVIISTYEKVAKLYWGNNIGKVLNEINIQADALSVTPEGMKNEYIPLHTTEFGTINFAMLMVCHYNKPITFEEFMEINHGRVKEINQNEQDDIKTYKVDNFAYDFLSGGSLFNCYLYR